MAAHSQFDLLRQQLAYDRHQNAQQALANAARAPGKTGEKTDAIGARADAQAQRDEAIVARAELEDRIAFARIDLTLHQAPRLRRTERPDLEVAMRREGPGFFARLGDALAEGGRLGLNLIIGLAYLWPLWLGAALAVLAWRAWRYATPQAKDRARPAMLALAVTVFPLNTHLAFYSTFWGGLTLMLAALYAGSLLARDGE